MQAWQVGQLTVTFEKNFPKSPPNIWVAPNGVASDLLGKQ